MKKNSEYIGVDDKFIPENEKYVDDSILGNKEESKAKTKKVLKIALGSGLAWFLLVVVLAIGMMIFGFSMFKSHSDRAFNTFNSISDLAFNSISGQGSEFINSVLQQKEETQKESESIQSQQGELQDKISSMQSKMDIESFNSNFELYSGTSSKLFVTTLLDKVVTNNKKNSDKIITVIYNKTNTTNPTEIIKLKQSFEQGKDYEVIIDYDTNGYVNKVTIEDI